MPDSRFFTTQSPLTADEVATLINGTLILGPPTMSVTHVADYRESTPGSVVYVEKMEQLDKLEEVSSSIYLIPETALEDLPRGAVFIAVSSPRAAFARVAAMLHESILHGVRSADLPQEVPRIAPSAIINENATLYPGCIIMDGVRIEAGSVIGPGVVIGEKSYIGTNVSISHALVGSRCHISAGAVIGEAGFGYVLEDNNTRVPQLGRVIVGDDVDIGANTTIDRGMLGDTIIGERSKIDNQVQIAHNVTIGAGCVIASQVGISGSTIIEDNVIMAGRAATAGHLRIGKGARILAGSGVSKDVAAGATWFGYPARPAKEWKRREAGLALLLKARKTQNRENKQ